MPSYSDISYFIQHAGPGAAAALAFVFVLIILADFRGYWHTDREFQREVKRGDDGWSLAKEAVDNTKAQQDQIEKLTDVVEKLTDQLGQRSRR